MLTSAAPCFRFRALCGRCRCDVRHDGQRAAADAALRAPPALSLDAMRADAALAACRRHAMPIRHAHHTAELKLARLFAIFHMPLRFSTLPPLLLIFITLRWLTPRRHYYCHHCHDDFAFSSLTLLPLFSPPLMPCLPPISLFISRRCHC